MVKAPEEDRDSRHSSQVQVQVILRDNWSSTAGVLVVTANSSDENRPAVIASVNHPEMQLRQISRWRETFDESPRVKEEPLVCIEKPAYGISILGQPYLMRRPPAGAIQSTKMQQEANNTASTVRKDREGVQ